jgi:YVTN family beta-propeller protein
MKKYYALSCLLALPLAANTVRIYQTNSAGDAVDIIDAATNTVVLQVKDIELPHGVAFSPDGSRAYISCEAENTLWATNTKTGKLLGKASLSGHPNNIAISRDGRRVFVGIVADPGAVEVVDTASLKSIKSVAVKGGVHNTYMTPDGKFVVAGSVVGKILTVIDAQALQPVWELPFDRGVRPMAFEKGDDGSTSRMFVQLSGLHGFAVVNFKTHEVVAVIKLPDEPLGGTAQAGAPSPPTARRCGSTARLRMLSMLTPFPI